MNILLVDDDRSVRALIEHELIRQGHSVVAVSDGMLAWEAILQEPFDLLISDWEMPEIDGLDLCRLVRSMDPGLYIYTILISSYATDEDIVAAFEAGADDFVSKPIHFPILLARIRAGERLVRLERELARRSETLLETNLRLQEARTTMDRDLQAGAELQHTLLPPPQYCPAGYASAWLYRPHSIVAGDMLNLFERDENTLVFYLFDVVGHGIRSALLTVSITKMLTSPGRFTESMAPSLASAEAMLQSLNDRFQSVDTSQYFTLVYGTIDRATGLVHLGQAGHPPPVLVRPDGTSSHVGEGGIPIGWLPDTDFATYDFELAPGGRLVVYSDGVSECENPEGEMFGKERLAAHFVEMRHLPLADSVAALERKLDAWAHGARIADDVSLLAIERL
jgi:sigma-B regulation protein RsbU (phosphoserine phosphatase)